MRWLTSLLAIPHRYPAKIKHSNTRLLPLAVLDIMDFRIEIGHDTPKQSNIKTSSNSVMLINSLL